MKPRKTVKATRIIHFIIWRSCHCQLLLWIILIALLLHYSANAVEAFPDVGEGDVKRREPKTDVIGRAKIGDDVQLLDHGAVDAVPFLVADADVRAAAGRVTWGA